MEKHINLLGILYLIYGGMALFAIGVVMVLFVGGFTAIGVAEGNQAPFWLAGAFGTFFLVILLVTAIPSIVCGYGLMHHRSWAKILCVVLSIFSLVEFPLGTALGVYGLWVLFHEVSATIFTSATIPASFSKNS